jgi:hypothetical protein
MAQSNEVKKKSAKKEKDGAPAQPAGATAGAAGPVVRIEFELFNLIY